ncbi:MAG: hypothetical protein LUQ69_07830 [Methanoregulaceae archaeon]|nr:hypothetical protein [Methanoregulaceae archaeon]
MERAGPGPAVVTTDREEEDMPCQLTITDGYKRQPRDELCIGPQPVNKIDLFPSRKPVLVYIADGILISWIFRPDALHDQ